MKVRILSDLHLSPLSLDGGFHYKDYGEDVCILAGDIGEGMQGVRWAERNIPDHIQVLYVPGNHEYYGQEYHELNDKFYTHNVYGSHVRVLINSVATINGVTFAGSTLWTNFRAYNNPLSPLLWKGGLNDSIYIRYGNRSIEAEDLIALNEASLDFLDKVTANILITHYCPSTSDITKWKGNPLTPGFVTEIPENIHRKFEYHIHGHTHEYLRYKNPGLPEVICNPRGYSNRFANENARFQEDLIIEI